MKGLFSRVSSHRITILMAGCALGFSTQGYAQLKARVVDVTAGANLAEIVNAQPAGTTFNLAAGVYRMQSVQPKNNDIFVGVGKVVLRGSQVLSFTADKGTSGLWVATAQALTTSAGQCQAAYPLCGYTQDLYINGVALTPVASQAEVVAGTWYFDRKNNLAYLPSDPAGTSAEIGMTEFAFSGAAQGVKIENLMVELYANPAQTGAVGGYKDGTNWTVNNVEALWNHGTGISLGGGGQILNCFSHNNGQMGIGITGGTGSKVANTELSWNNYAGFDTGWEAGGSKFWNTTNLTVENNYVHDNRGNGLWTDYDNIGTVYSGNTISNNKGAGILHEISYDATITGNTLEGNGDFVAYMLTSPQILLMNSQNVQIYSNSVTVPSYAGDGIGLLNEARGTGSRGVWVASNNSVHNNRITYLGTGGVSGILSYSNGPTPAGNKFDYNSYVLPAGGTQHWLWLTNQKMLFPQLQSKGQETHGVTTK